MAESQPPDDVSSAIARLNSLHENERAVIDVVAFGRRAIPPLRSVLFEREPSGLFQARCRAVDALSALGAHDVLMDFLSTQRDIRDPVERVGEEAVINAAARSLGNLREEKIFTLLSAIAETRILPGVVSALGSFERSESAPYFVAALAEDESRAAAEAALRRLGPRARGALLAQVKDLTSADVSDSYLRQRRSCLQLLSEIGILPQDWPTLRPALQDPDSKVAIFACAICLLSAPLPDRSEAFRRLITLLEKGEWAQKQETEELLVRHLERDKQLIQDAIRDSFPDDPSAKSRIWRILVRAKARGRQKSVG